MDKKELSQAFSGLHAPDALVRQVLAPAKPQKRPVRVWQIARRVAVCAAVLAVLICVVLLWGGTGENAPYVSVIVYADNGNAVEIKLPDQNSAISNTTNGGYLSAPPIEDDKTRFFFCVLLNEYEKQYVGYKVYQDGEELKRNNTKELAVGTVFSLETNKENGKDHYIVSTQTSVCGYTEKKTVIEIHYLKEGGDLLLKCVISVTPQEDDFLIVLEEVYVPEA